MCCLFIALGNGATNVVFPLTMICLAFSLMFGDGSSAYLSLKLGENKKDEAKKEITRIDKLRGNHYKHYTRNEWKTPSNYDICINSDSLGIEKTANYIAEIIKQKFKI